MNRPKNHLRIANYLTREIGKITPLETGIYIPNNENIVEFTIKEYKPGEKSKIIFLIEICNKDNYNETVKRCINCNKNILEKFIYQYDTKVLKKFYNKNKIIDETYSNYLNLDLWDFVKDYVKFVDQTS
ncbi:MAG: hypothetical protein IKQ46_06685 [Bacteroidales bacterium]|nr:hypothetical protein [Bacteroidales bacterium]